MNLFAIPVDLLLRECYINGIMEYTTFWYWLLFLGKMPLRFIHLVAYIKNVLLWLCNSILLYRHNTIWVSAYWLKATLIQVQIYSFKMNTFWESNAWRVMIVNNIVLYNWKLLREHIFCSDVLTTKIIWKLYDTILPTLWS